MRLRIPKQGVRRQNEKSKSEYVFSTDYWILTSDYFNIASIKARRAAPPTSNSLFHALFSMPFQIRNPQSAISI